MQTLAASDTVFHEFHSRNSEAQKDLEEFLYLSISVELLKYGLSSSRMEENTDLTLKIDYLLENNRADISLELLDRRKSLAATTFESPVNSTFRKTIGDEVGKLMAQIKAKESLSGESTATIKDVIILDDPKSVNSSREDGSLKNSFAVEVGLAPGGQFYFGDFSDYVSWGLNGGTSLSFLWKRQKMIFGLAVDAWGSRGFNGENAVGGPLYLTSAGGRFLWGLRTGADQFIALYGEGGIAPLLLAKKGERVLVETCPYFEVGTDFRVVRIRNLNIDLTVGYRAIFEADMIISSLEPSVSLNYKLGK